jgi:hypothetical protein
MKGVTMLMMPATMQDGAFCQGKENNHQQTMGATVMTVTAMGVGRQGGQQQQHRQ